MLHALGSFWRIAVISLQREIDAHFKCAQHSYILYDKMNGGDMGLKTSCNTTINKTLLNEAKSLNIKLSTIFESALAQAVREEKQKIWFEQNQSAIKSHNQAINESGTFSESIGQLK